MRLIMVVLALLFCVSSPISSQVPDDKLIVPGVRIGKWPLEMTIEDLVRMNGPGLPRTVEPRTGAVSLFPEAAEDVRDIMGIRVWPELGLGAAHRQGRTQVEYLTIGFFGSSSASVLRGYSTAQGSAWGHSQDRVIAAYGPPTARTKASNVRERLIYNDIGIAFVLLSTSGPASASEIIIFRPGSARAIWKF